MRARDLLGIREFICTPGCEECGGIGYLGNDAPIDDPRFGKLDLCPNVDRWSLPGAELYGLTRDEIERMNWDAIADKKAVQSAIEAITEILERGYGWLYIHGPFGSAKTFLLKIAIARSLRDNEEASYVRMVQIIDNLRGAFGEDNPSHESASRLDFWSRIPILAIDEIDRVRPTEYSIERQFILMDRRYEDAIRQKSITIMASNKSTSELAAEVDGYLADRIEDGRFKIVELNGTSRRSRMLWKDK